MVELFRHPSPEEVPCAPRTDQPCVADVLRIRPHHVTERAFVWDLSIALYRADLRICIRYHAKSTHFKVGGFGINSCFIQMLPWVFRCYFPRITCLTPSARHIWDTSAGVRHIWITNVCKIFNSWLLAWVNTHITFWTRQNNLETVERSNKIVKIRP